MYHDRVTTYYSLIVCLSKLIFKNRYAMTNLFVVNLHVTALCFDLKTLFPRIEQNGQILTNINVHRRV